jgi:hypothetical protein
VFAEEEEEEEEEEEVMESTRLAGKKVILVFQSRNRIRLGDHCHEMGVMQSAQRPLRTILT